MRLSILLPVLLAAALFACTEPASEPDESASSVVRGEADDRGRVFLIGIDGASPHVMEELLAAGRLPALSALARTGVWGPLRSMRPLLSPRIWTTVATGKNVPKHGIGGFRTPAMQGKPQRLYDSSDRKVHALWNIASAHGFSVGVVNWWVTHPAEVIRGVMVSDRLIPKLLSRSGGPADAMSLAEGAIFPLDWQQRAVDAVSTPELPVVFDAAFLADESLPHWIDREKLSLHLRTDAAATHAALAVEAELKPDVLMVFLPGIDRVSHWLWGSREPEELYPPDLRPTPAEREAGKAALLRYYEYVDALIGRITESAGPNDLTIVLSDHGFEGGIIETQPKLTGLHKSLEAIHGVVFASGPGVPAGQKTAQSSILDVTPTILHWLGLPPARDINGRIFPFFERGPAAQLPAVASYDVGTVERLGNTQSGERAMLEQLRSLGYIE